MPGLQVIPQEAVYKKYRKGRTMGYNIAIDGPAGAGKSTIARLTAKELDMIYIDTGAMYRAVACYFIANGLSADEQSALSACDNIDIDVVYEEDVQQIILNGENITLRLRDEVIGNMASKVAKIGCIREKLVDIQRSLAEKENVIMDGRDIGTRVLPDADIKIYLTAAVSVRAKRRYDELTAKNISCDIKEIEKDIENRDYEDMHRKISPLKKAEDAILLDTSDMDIRQVVDRIKEIYERVCKNG